MPEGHTIHRYARLHRDAFVGHQVAARSPQGRFAGGAARLDGTMLCGVDAVGKHLLYRFAAVEPADDGGADAHGARSVGNARPGGGAGARGVGSAGNTNPAIAGDDLTLHVHLGLFGRFRQYRDAPRPPTPGTRLVLSTSSAELQLAGPTACELIDPEAEDALRARLGPDPLADDDPEPAHAALRRRRAGIGQVLLDQAVIAGVGNVYRAELLFLLGIHPDRPANRIDRPSFDELWHVLRRLLRDGEKRGRIITVQPEDRAKPPSRLRRDERLYVYKRTGLPCRRCGSPIRSWELAARTVFACPNCQPA